MSALSDLKIHIEEFWQLPYHQEPTLAAKLNDVQEWQRARICQTHATLFAQPKNAKMAQYFVEKLYGGDEFTILAKQLERIVPKAQKIEKLAPTAALTTGTLAIDSAILATKLDLDLAAWLVAQDLPVNRDNMLSAYRAVNAAEQRCEQLHALKEVCYRTDKYINSFMLQKAFTLTKGTAYKYNYQPLYDFIEEGFAAMKPLKSVASFIEPVCQRELQIIEQVHSPNLDSDADPFHIDCADND